MPRETDQPTPPEVRVGLLAPEEWGRLRDIRLAALAESPEMFGSTLERELELEEAEWRARAEGLATVIASAAGRDVGLAGVHEFDGVWRVVAMWIDPRARGTGVVEALMGACEAVARGAGADTLTLAVMEDNPAGLRAYRRLGFTPTGERHHIRDGRYAAWMTKPLTPTEERPLTRRPE